MALGAGALVVAFGCSDRDGAASVSASAAAGVTVTDGVGAAVAEVSAGALVC